MATWRCNYIATARTATTTAIDALRATEEAELDDPVSAEDPLAVDAVPAEDPLAVDDSAPTVGCVPADDPAAVEESVPVDSVAVDDAVAVGASVAVAVVSVELSVEAPDAAVELAPQPSTIICTCSLTLTPLLEQSGKSLMMLLTYVRQAELEQKASMSVPELLGHTLVYSSPIADEMEAISSVVQSAA